MKLLLVLSLSFLAIGCNTITRGDSQKMKVNTDPQGATVTVDGKNYTSPAVISFKRKQSHKVVVSKSGYQPITFDMTSQWDAASLPQLALPGGSAMMAADTVTGADRSFRDLKPIKLTPVGQPTTQPSLRKVYRGTVMTPAEYDKAMAEERANTTRFGEGR
jgi:hypothetical protein